MLKLICISILSVGVYGYPKSPVIQDINSVKDGKMFKDLYNIIRSHEVQQSFQNGSEKLVETILSQAVQVSPENQGCECCGYDCGCCAHIKIAEIGLNSIVCANVSYLPTDYQVSAALTIDHKTIINVTLSARNPPPICAGVPYLEKLASICLRFSDVTVSKTSFGACLSLEVHLAFIKIADVPLGCFLIPPEGSLKQGTQPCVRVNMDKKGQPIYKGVHDNQSLEKKSLLSGRVQDIWVEFNRN